MSTLHLLRDFLLQNPTSPPVLESDSIHLGPHRLPRLSRTAWRLKKGDYLDVASVVFFINNEKLKLSEYVKACGQAGVQVIPYGERKDFQEWLKGGQDVHQHIDQEVVAQQQATEGKGDTTGATTTSQPSTASTTSTTATVRDGSAPPVSGREAVVGSKRSHAMVDGSTELSARGERERAATGSSADGTSSASTDGRGGSLLPPSLWQLSDVLREEVVYLNRVSCLQGSKDLGSVGVLWDGLQKARLSAEKHRKEEKHRAKAHPSAPSSSRGSSVPSHSSRSSSSASSIPIILVPSSLSSCISLYNAKQFLEDGLLIPTAVKRAETPNQVKPTTVRIARLSVQDSTRTASYDVMDDTSLLKSADWKRVVAVFVAGTAWQFEGWPAPYTSPAAIFAAIPAFYLSYADEVANKNVQQWKVHLLQAHRAKNYADRGLQMEFWNVVTEHMKQQHSVKGITF